MTDWNIYDQHKDRNVWNLADQLNAKIRAHDAIHTPAHQIHPDEVAAAVERCVNGQWPHYIEVKTA